LKLSYLKRILAADNPQASQAAITYAAYLNEIQPNAENYPLFLEVLGVQNRWAIDALTENADLENFLDAVVPTYYLVQQIFELFSNAKRGELYPKVLIILLGYLRKVYRQPERGYEVYPLTIPDLNNMAKFLNEEQPHTDPINNLLLAVLRDINGLNELAEYKDVAEEAEIATQAGRIRSDYFDVARTLQQSLTNVLLEPGVETDGVPPEYLYGGEE
jgi:hypothetical protein